VIDALPGPQRRCSYSSNSVASGGCAKRLTLLLICAGTLVSRRV
jgi:hypothetical protein